MDSKAESRTFWLVLAVVTLVLAGSWTTAYAQDQHMEPSDGDVSQWLREGERVEAPGQQQELFSLLQKLKQAESERDGLQRDVEALASTVRDSKNENVELRKQVDLLVGKLEAASEQNRLVNEQAGSQAQELMKSASKVEELEAHILDLKEITSNVASLEAQVVDLENMASKIASLEAQIVNSEKVALKAVDLEKSLTQELELTSRLQAELHQLKAKVVGSEEELEKYTAVIHRAEDAERQVGELSTHKQGLEDEIKWLRQKNEKLEGNVKAVESSLASHTQHNEFLSSTSEDTKRKLAEVEQTLKITEAAMLTAEAEAAAKGKALLQAYRHWLPPWAAVRLAELQVVSSAKWAEHGQPAVAVAYAQLKKQAAALHEWAKPHLSKIAAALSKMATYFGQAAEPAMDFAKEQHAKLWPLVYRKWASMVQTVGPHVEVARVELNKFKASTKAFARPHIETARTVSEPYIQLVREKCKPTVDIIIEKVGPHVEKARTHLDPHIKSANALYVRSLVRAKDIHQQVEGKIRKTLLSYPLTTPYALDNVVWFLAAASFLLPLAALYIFFSPYRRSASATSRAKSSPNVTHRHRKHTRRSSNKSARTSTS